MQTTTFLFTNPGGRLPNEDAKDTKDYANGRVWALADGLGGHAHGELASQIAVKRILELDPATPDLPGALAATADRINEAVLAQRGSRTTLVTALLNGELLTYANLGDSRLYYFRNGELLQRTADHSVAYSDYESGEVAYEDIRFHPDRSRLTQAFGAADTCRLKVYPEIRIQPGDAFLMCSDGFWENVFETEMRIDLVKSAQPKEWIDLMLLRIVRRMKKDCDNFTAIAVMVRP